MRKLVVAVAVLAAALFVVPGVSVAAVGSKHAASAGDRDHDGVDTRNERRQGTDPRKRDSDGDGVSDGREDADRDGLPNAIEDATGNDPIDRDSDDDGVADGREGAGVVTAFGGGTLTVKLAGGGSASGAVDEFTAVSCPTEAGYERTQPRALRKGGKRKRKQGKRGNGAHASALAFDAPQAGELDAARAGDLGAPRAGELDASRAGDLLARAAQEEDDDDWSDEAEDWTDEDGDDSGGDEDWADEDDAGDDSAEDDGSDPAPSACLAGVKRGTRVHASVVESDDEGSFFVELALVR